MHDAVNAFLDNKEQESVSAPWLRELKREMLDFAAWCDAKVLYRELRKVNLLVLEDSAKTGRVRRSPGTSDRSDFVPSSITA